MTSQVVDAIWFTGITGANGPIGIIVVEDETTHERRAYIGFGHGDNEREDIEAIKAWGVPFTDRTIEWLQRSLNKKKVLPREPIT